MILQGFLRFFLLVFFSYILLFDRILFTQGLCILVKARYFSLSFLNAGIDRGIFPWYIHKGGRMLSGTWRKKLSSLLFSSGC